MKTTKSIIGLIAIVVMTGMVVMFSACESDSDIGQQAVDDFFGEDFVSGDRDATGNKEDLSITPASASVDTIGEKISFGVRGGNKPYTWSVSDSTSGTVTPTTTKNDIEKVVYTCAQLKKNTVVCTDGLGRAAVVDVTANSPNLSVSPGSVKYLATDVALAAGPQSYTFTSTGGTTPITWDTDSPSLGGMVGSVWTSINGIPASTWSNATIKVIATDSAGVTANATITFE